MPAHPSVRLLAAMIAASALSSTGPAHAGGFALREQGVSGLGNAYAGAAAVAEDASTIFYNPAGMARLRGNQILGGATYVAPDLRFTNTSSRVRDSSTSLLTGSNGGDAGQDSVVPHGYAMWDVSPDLKLGIGITSPFGLITSYDDDWVGRYHAITSKVATRNIQPTVSYRVNPGLSVGAGLQAQQIDTTLTKAIDFAGLCTGNFSDFACSILAFSRPRDDGHLRLTGDSWGYGFTLGVLYEPSPSTRIGLGFRSKVEHTLKGEADFTVQGLGNLLTVGTNLYQDTSAKADITTPESLSLSIVHELNARWSLLGDVTWTNWSRFKELRFRYGNGQQPDTVMPQNWKDSYYVAVGATYKPDETWVYRFGIAYDQSATRDADRSALQPDNDRLRVSLGASYALTPALTLNIGYAHIFVAESSIDSRSASLPNIRGFTPLFHRLIGSYDNHVDMLGIGASLKF